MQQAVAKAGPTKMAAADCCLQEQHAGAATDHTCCQAHAPDACCIRPCRPIREVLLLPCCGLRIVPCVLDAQDVSHVDLQRQDMAM